MKVPAYYLLRCDMKDSFRLFPDLTTPSRNLLIFPLVDKIGDPLSEISHRLPSEARSSFGYVSNTMFDVSFAFGAMEWFNCCSVCSGNCCSKFIDCRFLASTNIEHIPSNI